MRRRRSLVLTPKGGDTMRRKSLRSQLYRGARDLGNLEAAEKGPASYGRRVVRRKVYRTTNGTLQRGLRKLGLWR